MSLCVLIVDDHGVLADGLAMALTAEGLPAKVHVPTSADGILQAVREEAPVLVLLDLDALAEERTALGTSGQRHALRRLVALRARRRGAAGVAEPDQGMPAEVRDEERDLARAEVAGEALPHDVRRGERRRVLDGGEERAQVQVRRGVPRHGRVSVRGA